MSTIGWNNSIRSFLTEAGSEAPTPGGGSVAALVAALGASMTSMVANLSQGTRFAEVQPHMKNIVEDMRAFSERCEHLLASDISSFNAYMLALKLPKLTDEEKLARTQAIEQATVGAIETPLALMELCRDGLNCADSIVHTSNKNVISDLGISILLFEAAAQSALLTIEINLAGLKNRELKERFAKQIELLLEEIMSIKATSLEAIRSLMIN